jgi:hypothetical protein
VNAGIYGVVFFLKGGDEMRHTDYAGMDILRLSYYKLKITEVKYRGKYNL